MYLSWKIAVLYVTAPQNINFVQFFFLDNGYFWEDVPFLGRVNMLHLHHNKYKVVIYMGIKVTTRVCVQCMFHV